MKDIKYFKILFKYLKEDRFYLILYVIFSILSNVLPVVESIMWAKSLENLSINNQPQFIIYLFLWLVTIFTSWCLCKYITHLLFNKLDKDFIIKANTEMYHKTLNLPAIAFEEMGVGELTNRLNSDLDNIISILSRLVGFSSRFITAIVILIYAFIVSIYVGLEVIALCIVMYLLANVYFPKIKKTQESISKETDQYVKNLTEDLNGIREIKALGIKENAYIRMSRLIENVTNKQRKLSKDEFTYYFINDTCYFIITFIILLTLGLLVFSNQITIAIFFIMQNLINRLDNVVENISDFTVAYNKIVVSLKRVDEIINNRKYQDEQYGNIELVDKKITINFNNVRFKYRREENYVLKGLELELKPNKKIAIVGKSGQGKTTIFNLLMRYFDSTTGNITLNNTNIKDISESSLRESISIIRQNPYLFNRSVLDNFRLIKEDVTLKEVREVCKKAYIDDYIMSLPKKYNTIIGEGGINLSGGQKQRLAIARTLLKNTKVILFDEATSALDNESQEYIKKTIDDLVKTHTIIIVAHRLSTIMDADIIYLIENGKVEASGTHKQLLKKSNIYQRLYNPELSTNEMTFN